MGQGTGIRRDRYGLRAYVKYRGVQREKRFKPGTPEKVIQRWREDTRRELERTRPTIAPSSLNAAVDTYVKRIQHLASWVEVRAHLRAWCARYGQYDVSTLTPTDIDAAIGYWLNTDTVAPKTINHRVLYFRRMWRVLYPNTPSPADHFRPLPVHKTPPVVIASDLVLKVLQKLTDPKDAARLMVIASTGRRPSEIARTQPDDVDLTRRVWIPRDGKGGWSPGVYLNDDMLVAWTWFAVAEAWGPFNESYWVEQLKKADWPCIRDRRGHLRASPPPYQLRHSVGLLMSDAGVDLADIQAHLGHKHIATTRKHYVPVLNTRMQRASELLAGRFNWLPAGLPAFSGGARRILTVSGANLITQNAASDQAKPRVSRRKHG